MRRLACWFIVLSVALIACEEESPGASGTGGSGANGGSGGRDDDGGNIDGGNMDSAIDANAGGTGGDDQDSGAGAGGIGGVGGVGGGTGGIGGTGGVGGVGGTGGNDPCACSVPSDCDDQIDCTVDDCVGGLCTNVIDGALCGAGKVCDLREGGCSDSPTCGDTAECTDSDPCTRNERCDHAQATCKWDPIDTDADGHPAELCGGDDVNDADDTVFTCAP